MSDVSGFAAPGFETMREVFAAQLAREGAGGAAVCVYFRGEPVVDLWGGRASARSGAAWQRDTLCMPFSVAKPMVALCALKLVERGLLALDRPVARDWPEFAAAGKAEVTLRQLLSHQAGVIAVDEALPPEAILDWKRVTRALAAARPRFPPGTAHGECARFYGHLVGELVLRTDGRSIGRFFREEVAEPFGIDFHFGLRAPELARCADMLAFSAEDAAELARHRGPLAAEALDNPPGITDERMMNSEAFRRAEVPAINGHGTAHGVARLYAVLADGGALDGKRLLSESSVDDFLQVQRDDVDLVFAERAAWALGVQRDPFGGFGLGGLGGHLGMGQRAHRMGIGFVRSRLGRDEAAGALLVAVAKSIALLA
jgi:CubicO group peptidase (beta-lactamase class C family)